MSDNQNGCKEPELLSAKKVIQKLINGEIENIQVEGTLVCGAETTVEVGNLSQKVFCVKPHNHDGFHYSIDIPRYDTNGKLVEFEQIGWPKRETNNKLNRKGE